jgi:competence protein ComEA
MKSFTAIEGPADAGSKDKQTLVLFLLACCILVLPPLFRQSPPSQPVYSLACAAGTEQWQMVSLPSAEMQQQSDAESHLIVQQLNVSGLFFDGTQSDSLPAGFALFFHRPLPLNKSRLEDLTMLPGIGPYRAAMVLAERQKKGRLAGAEDLLAVPGIGPATLQRLLPLVSFE